MIKKILGTKNKIIVYAPNIDGGGSLFLERFLDNHCIEVDMFLLPLSNYKKFSRFFKETKLHIVKKGIFFRLFWEIYLYFKASKTNLIICAGGLPLFFPSKAKLLVFLHNRLLLEPEFFKIFPLRRRIFLTIERYILFKFYMRIDFFIVFTLSMMRVARNTLVGIKIIKNEYNFLYNFRYSIKKKSKIFDFIYPASGDPHKNHKNLLEAFVLLSKEEIYPSIVLTIDNLLYPKLHLEILSLKKKFNLKITLIGFVSYDDLLVNYFYRSRALIYPSLCESIGMPLLEAKSLGVDILASDLDFVFDIVNPKLTFNPRSAESISIAIKRYVRGL